MEIDRARINDLEDVEKLSKGVKEERKNEKI